MYINVCMTKETNTTLVEVMDLIAEIEPQVKVSHLVDGRVAIFEVDHDLNEDLKEKIKTTLHNVGYLCLFS